MPFLGTLVAFHSHYFGQLAYLLLQNFPSIVIDLLDPTEEVYHKFI